MSTDATAHSEAAVEQVGGRSRVVTCRSVAPLRLLVPSTTSVAAWIVQSSYGGGLVQGDVIRLRFRCGPRARVLLGTQANGRVYRHLEATATARQNTEGLVEAGGLVVVFPDPLVLHADSRFAQRQQWTVAEDASLVLGDWFQCGRSDNGERFAYASWDSETILYHVGKPVVIDRFHSEPAAEDPRAPGRFGEYLLMLNCYAIGPVAESLANALEATAAIEEARQIPATTAIHPPLRATVSRLEQCPGFILRALGRTREDFAPLVERLFAHLAEPDLLGFDPLMRRH